jgi:hypothetical protein
MVNKIKHVLFVLVFPTKQGTVENITIKTTTNGI